MPGQNIRSSVIDFIKQREQLLKRQREQAPNVMSDPAKINQALLRVPRIQEEADQGLLRTPPFLPLVRSARPCILGELCSNSNPEILSPMSNSKMMNLNPSTMSSWIHRMRSAKRGLGGMKKRSSKFAGSSSGWKKRQVGKPCIGGDCDLLMSVWQRLMDDNTFPQLQNARKRSTLQADSSSMDEDQWK